MHTCAENTRTGSRACYRVVARTCSACFFERRRWYRWCWVEQQLRLEGKTKTQATAKAQHSGQVSACAKQFTATAATPLVHLPQVQPSFPQLPEQLLLFPQVRRKQRVALAQQFPGRRVNSYMLWHHCYSARAHSYNFELGLRRGFGGGVGGNEAFHLLPQSRLPGDAHQLANGDL